jgi:hypothetical protein
VLVENECRVDCSRSLSDADISMHQSSVYPVRVLRTGASTVDNLKGFAVQQRDIVSLNTESS